ncbi:MAG: hypothetical protein ACRD1W_16505, partial [Vicinamibacterales bacterium]
MRDRSAIVAGILALSIIGGAIGAVGAWFAFGYFPAATAVAAFALSLTIIGWMASSYLSEEAQRRMFRHNLINTARIEIVKAIRDNQGWLSELEGFTMALRIGFEHRKHIQGASVGRLQEILSKSPAAEMIMRLEEYE